jgi:hypothetical protein
LNEAFLRRFGSNWYDPRLYERSELALGSSEGRTFVDQIAMFLEEQPSEPPLLIKEPRITALTAFWFPAARRVGLQIAAVVAVRHPAEVAGSLAARDGVPPELSNTLWAKYNWLAERRSREIPRVFVGYPNLLADWRREVERVARSLAMDLSATKDAEIEAFLCPDLRRQRADNALDDPSTSIERVHTMLSRACRDEEFSKDEFEHLIAAHMRSDEAGRAIEQFAEQFSPAVLN